jgi:hypothetical protein
VIPYDGICQWATLIDPTSNSGHTIAGRSSSFSAALGAAAAASGPLLRTEIVLDHCLEVRENKKKQLAAFDSLATKRRFAKPGSGRT